MAMCNEQDKEAIILCVSNSYKQKYYFNPVFDSLPDTIKQELQIMCVLYTEDVGGILALQFDEKGNLLLNVTSEDNDYFFDEIGSVLKIKQIQREKVELLESVEIYYKAVFLKEDVEELLEKTRED